MSKVFKGGDNVYVETTIGDIDEGADGTFYAVYSGKYNDPVWVEGELIVSRETTDAQILRRAAKICEENFGSVILTTNRMLELADTFDPPEVDIFEAMQGAYKSLMSVHGMHDSPETKKLFIALKQMEKERSKE